ncbi:MAG: family efflux transporter, subunit [Lacunisphaera sp.]|nr:family efflux transporter, subunit [Lacunisphaera sp.]
MKKVLIFLLVAALVAGGWFIFKPKADAAAEEPAKPAAKVETTALADQAIAQTIEVFGVEASAPSGDSVTTATYDLNVLKVKDGVGTPVAAGDVLLEVEPSPEAKLAADSARTALEAANKTLAAVQERYDLKLSSSQDLQTAQQAADDAKLKVDSLTARGMTGDGHVVAAETGVVSKLDVSSGTLAPAGTALVTVSTGGQMEVRLGVEAADVSTVAIGQAVTIESSNRAEPEKVVATVRIVGGSLDPATGAAEVRAAVPAGAPLLLGEHVRAEIELQKKEHALVVPRGAVLPDDDKHILFTVKDGKAVKHEVKLGLATDELLEVIGEGLQAGDVVVTLGNYELEDGMEIQVPEKEEKKDDKKDEAKDAAKDETKDETKAAAKPAVEAKP